MDKAAKQAFKMRKKYIMPEFKIQNWFPGHMYTAMQKMKRRLSEIDCVLEVHDARIPLTGRNPNLEYKLSLAPRLLVLNKRDLISFKMEKSIKNSLEDKGVRNIVFTDCTNPNDSGVRQIIPRVIEMMDVSERIREVDNYKLMVAGVPNVGKSSLINILRNTNLGKTKVAKVGALAGVTRSVMEKVKIAESPPIYLLDTPGITVPSIDDNLTVLKLGLCSTLSEKVLKPDILADYLLYYLNKHKNYSYVKYLGLPEPCDEIKEVMIRTAVHHNLRFISKDFQGRLVSRPDMDKAANFFIDGFRKGKLGPICLDQDNLY